MPRGRPRKDAPLKGHAERKSGKPIQQAIAQFRDALKDGGLRPSIFLLKLMRGETIEHDGAEMHADFSTRVSLAQHLVQFELPRLAAIEADVTSITKTHEDWIAELAAEEAEQPEERTLQ